MQSNLGSTSTNLLEVRCDRCGAKAAVRSGRDYLCPTCAELSAVGSPDHGLVMCDVCDRESLVRLGEQFLCASCAMDVLRESVEDLDAVAGARSADQMVREGTMQLVDAAAAHHQALARSMKRARDTDECVRRVEAGAVLFNVWAFSFDARLEDLEEQNRALRLVVRELATRGRVPLARTSGVGFAPWVSGTRNAGSSRHHGTESGGAPSAGRGNRRASPS
jgi:hypothetical protein